MDKLLRYQGEFRNDKACGSCRIEFGDEAKFQGSLDENENLCGDDCLFENGKVRYTGQFANGQMEGVGKIEHFDTGAVYQGEFKGGQKHGKA